jgi:hypothetical protein
LRGAKEFQALMKQRTWEKDVVLWFGPEKALLEALGSSNRIIIDLLDLFDPDNLPADDEATKDTLSGQLRQRLRTIPREPSNPTVLVVKSVGLLVRYKIGLKDFYDWFVSSHTVVALLIESLPQVTKWPEEVVCDADRLFGYFAEPGMVKNIYAADR